MRKLVFASLLTITAAATAAFADDWTGYISDAHCGAAHNSVSDANTACIHKCLHSGSDPVLVSGDKVVKIDAASRDKALPYAGENVKVTGTKSGDSITIDSIEKAQ